VTESAEFFERIVPAGYAGPDCDDPPS